MPVSPNHDVEIALIKQRLDHIDKNYSNINTKLDSLLELRHKGVGVFWLASAILGTGILGTFMAFLDWVKS